MEDFVFPSLLDPAAAVVAASCCMSIADDAIHVLDDVFLQMDPEKVSGTVVLFVTSR